MPEKFTVLLAAAAVRWDNRLVSIKRDKLVEFSGIKEAVNHREERGWCD